MIRAFVLLIATLAAIALAAPAPRLAPSHDSFGKAPTKKHTHSFKSFANGHRGHVRNPVTELTRIAHKFHWSISLPLGGSIVLDWPNGESDSYGSPGEVTGSSSDSGYGSSADGYESSTGSGDAGSDSGSDAGSYTIQTSMATQPTATNSPPAYPSEDPTDAESTNLNAFSSDLTFTTSVRVSFSATAAATASTSASAGGGGGDNGEVNAHPEENESEYLSPVSIGGQKLNLNFDTGSADL